MVGVCHSIDMQVEFLKFNPRQQVFSYKNSIIYIYTHTRKQDVCNVTNITHICKVVIYNYVFVGFNSVPNLIVILFNLIYPVFHVGFICKSCVRERECRLKAIEG